MFFSVAGEGLTSALNKLSDNGFPVALIQSAWLVFYAVVALRC